MQCLLTLFMQDLGKCWELHTTNNNWQMMIVKINYNIFSVHNTEHLQSISSTHMLTECNKSFTQRGNFNGHVIWV